MFTRTTIGAGSAMVWRGSRPDRRGAFRHSASLVALLALLAGAMLLRVSTVPASAAGFSNSTAVPIGPAAGLSPVSSIVVAGQPAVTTDVNVTLAGFTHSNRTWDVDVLLQGPTGVRVMLMSDFHGSNGTCSANGTPHTYTFDDAAVGPMAIASGVYKPTDYDGAGCDATGDGFVPTPTATVLSAFNGTDPNGTWKLYVADDDSAPWGTDPSGGTLAGGWALDIASTNPPPPPAPPAATVTPTPDNANPCVGGRLVKHGHGKKAKFKCKKPNHRKHKGH